MLQQKLHQFMSASVNLNDAATALRLQPSTWTLQQQLYVCSCQHERCSTALCMELQKWGGCFATTKSTLDKQNCLLFLPKSEVSPLTDANSVTAEPLPIFAASKVVTMSYLSESANLCLQQQTGFLQQQNYAASAPQLWLGLPRVATGPKQFTNKCW